MSYKEICTDLRGAAKDFHEHKSIFESAAEAIEDQGKSIDFFEECIAAAIKDREYYEKDSKRLDWLIENEYLVAYLFGLYSVHDGKLNKIQRGRETPREAIDAAMAKVDRNARQV